MKSKMSAARLVGCFLAASVLGTAAGGQERMIDRIAAIVEESVITWTDVQIARDFLLFDISNGLPENQDLQVLERLIDQKLILQRMGEDMTLPEDQPGLALRAVLRRVGAERVEERLAFFGIGREDLEIYVKEKLLFQKITFERFKDSAFVGLKEMEAYYNDVYLPERNDIGLSPQPLLEILNDIEAAIKEGKIKKLVEEWLKTLRKEADIQIFIGIRQDDNS